MIQTFSFLFRRYLLSIKVLASVCTVLLLVQSFHPLLPELSFGQSTTVNPKLYVVESSQKDITTLTSVLAAKQYTAFDKTVRSAATASGVFAPADISHTKSASVNAINQNLVAANESDMLVVTTDRGFIKNPKYAGIPGTTKVLGTELKIDYESKGMNRRINKTQLEARLFSDDKPACVLFLASVDSENIIPGSADGDNVFYSFGWKYTPPPQNITIGPTGDSIANDPQQEALVVEAGSRAFLTSLFNGSSAFAAMSAANTALESAYGGAYKSTFTMVSDFTNTELTLKEMIDNCREDAELDRLYDPPPVVIPPTPIVDITYGTSLKNMAEFYDNAASATFSVNLKGVTIPAGKFTRIIAQTVSGTAIGTNSGGTDFGDAIEVINFTPGGATAGAITVQILNNTTPDNADKTFTIVPTLSTNSTYSPPGLALKPITVILKNDDIQVSTSNISIIEGDGPGSRTVDLVLTRNGVFSDSDILLDLVSSDGSAKVADYDYAAINTTVRIPGSRSSSRKFSIAIKGDRDDENGTSNENFNITLSNIRYKKAGLAKPNPPTNPQLLTTTSTVTIINDDQGKNDAFKPYNNLAGTYKGGGLGNFHLDGMNIRSRLDKVTNPTAVQYSPYISGTIQFVDLNPKVKGLKDDAITFKSVYLVSTNTKVLANLEALKAADKDAKGNTIKPDPAHVRVSVRPETIQRSRGKKSGDIADFRTPPKVIAGITERSFTDKFTCLKAGKVKVYLETFISYNLNGVQLTKPLVGDKFKNGVRYYNNRPTVWVECVVQVGLDWNRPKNENGERAFFMNRSDNPVFSWNLQPEDGLTLTLNGPTGVAADIAIVNNNQLVIEGNENENFTVEILADDKKSQEIYTFDFTIYDDESGLPPEFDDDIITIEEDIVSVQNWPIPEMYGDQEFNYSGIYTFLHRLSLESNDPQEVGIVVTAGPGGILEETYNDSETALVSEGFSHQMATRQFKCSSPGTGVLSLLLEINGRQTPSENLVTEVECLPQSNAVCGDGIVEDDEFCDDENNVDGDGCNEVCLVEHSQCGDGVIQEISGEQCDDGNTDNGDGCSDLCKLESCGDGVVQLNDDEECDDGNMEGGDGCDEFCRLEPGECGDGFVDFSLNEQCDDANTSNNDGCSSTCELELCGDGIVHTTNEEQCDDGNNDNGDGCDAFCQVEGLS